MSSSAPLIYSRWLSRAGQHCQLTGRPLVGLSFAQSIDGSLTTQRGQPTALSGPESARLTHELRAAHDAILVGVGTVLADNPHLTVRHVPGQSPQPVILDSYLRTPPQAYLVAGHPTPAWIATTPAADPACRQALETAGARLLEIPAAPHGGVDLPRLLKCLSGLGIATLMVEGGAQVITRFLTEGLVDWVSITVAPRFLGGLRSVESPLPNLPALSEVAYQKLGTDLIIWGKLG